MDKIYSITEMAKELEITPRTIRFYEDQGLISPQRVGNTRIYSHRDRARMILILRGKRLGFSLKDIKEFLDLYVVDTTQVEQLKVLVGKVRERIAQLEEQLDTVQISLKELRDIERVSIGVLQSKGIDTIAV
ncbi:MerR family transcriptional regulator [Blastochloris viridis]|uniref:Predicted transcriptional regulator LiuR of leucine degradation pathway n=1 Tax=Blastochloris viridis TaxID=1079 RepID=A0A0H5BD63_BLAVI|nr:MerR family DNA-binding transcriptional regulator [Blastochloris viridis]ALK09927.1 HTH-type transcriptional regulator ZntR [Blastochloris viridis]BAS00163.1 predicted transcriptional regulator LiuR of leucine degradation pathway [Blastochloris viridis]CUU42590.1 Zn(II)-responsive regulator of zntA [Blastochloris viridis]